ncbi:PREDICTED: E3 ubiquitin-protein ligase MARCH6-like [Priapulus caudatus]|uniref:RING-type E3 ubiquitin transferase n=1 Tax=Priapulus caudatus TaxID=37621 RepID=A0ABM1DZF1_PRICU|nr:PREDICTED: E3 ubiquitin-protein ligase MARCH6-like [Priapulus caudatus]XP_014665322.1 PREDICTED: E3 ubiquitin-protein ligase MARCH6-like [Priapulus caudatus]
MEDSHQDICRVCRSESSPDRPLFYPCICTGSIKYIHQECLMQWLKYSKKEYCELCKHRFLFTPIYAPDMPGRLPIRDIISGLFSSVGTAIRYWLHFTLVALAWLGVVPLTACRIYRCLFTGSVSSLLTLPLDMLSTEHLLADCTQGCFVVMCTLCAFISLVWLREQILHGGAPEWLEPPDEPAADPNGNDAANEVVVAAAHEGAPAGEDAADGAAAGDGDDAQDVNWNPIEWDRAAEELTWERLLGLDGSLVFLEHVFWVISLNTLFILIFAFCPYHVGQFTIAGLHLDGYYVASHFAGLLTTLTGYAIIAGGLVALHTVAAATRLLRTERVVGLCYIVVKVSLLVVVEIGLFPLVCGWWLDVCSLPLFDATVEDRLSGFRAAPSASMFIHWLVGMVYVFYFASFVLLLREVLRPGVLWFLRNFNDPNFNPIQEMIHLPTYRHARRFLASLVLFGSTVLVMMWMPVKLIKRLFPTFLPYHVVLTNDTPVSELSLELLLLQVILPALLEQPHTRQWLKNLVRVWCGGVAGVLNLRSYLLGDLPLADGEDDVVVGNEPVQHVQPAPPPEGLVGLGAEHHAILLGGGPTGFQPYRRPAAFALRIAALLALVSLTLLLGSVACLVAPVWIGRRLMRVWMGSSAIHELYTTACGLYVCWVATRASTLLYGWLPHGRAAIAARVRERAALVVKSLVLTAILLGVVPLLLGCLVEQVVITPIRIPLDQTPIHFPWQDWALGVLHLKIICAATMMGPNWWLKRRLEQAYNDGLRDVRLADVVRRVCAPVVACLGLALALPYVAAHSLVPALGAGDELQRLIARRVYPVCTAALFVIVLLGVQTKQFRRLYEHIKNDKYLVGQRLVNYDRMPAAALARLAPMQQLQEEEEEAQEGRAR